jgi:arylformamidase
VGSKAAVLSETEIMMQDWHRLRRWNAMPALSRDGAPASLLSKGARQVAFENLPRQPQMGATAEAYAAKILARSCVVAMNSRVLLDVPYGDDYWQRMDIYLPAQDDLRDLPVLLFLHGGGWSNGYKEWMGFMAPCFTDLPALFVSVGYRMLPDARFPMLLDDTVAALAWVHDNIDRHGGSPSRLFIGGHSAGGHLSALATLRRDKLAAAQLPEGVIKACFPVSSVFKFEIGELEERGKFLLNHPSDAPEASPINFVAGNRVPFYIVWGDNDLEYVLRTSPMMVEALKNDGGHVAYDILAGYDHFQPSLDGGRPNSRWVRTVRIWMSAR